GADIGIFNNALEFTFDYYIKKTSDMLARKLVPSMFGISGAPLVNLGDMENSGLEFSLSYHHTKSAFNWNVLANLAFMKNKVVRLAGSGDIITPNYGSESIIRLGSPL